MQLWLHSSFISVVLTPSCIWFYWRRQRSTLNMVSVHLFSLLKSKAVSLHALFLFSLQDHQSCIQAGISSQLGRCHRRCTLWWALNRTWVCPTWEWCHEVAFPLSRWFRKLRCTLHIWCLQIRWVLSLISLPKVHFVTISTNFLLPANVHGLQVWFCTPRLWPGFHESSTPYLFHCDFRRIPSAARVGYPIAMAVMLALSLIAFSLPENSGSSSRSRWKSNGRKWNSRWSSVISRSSNSDCANLAPWVDASWTLIPSLTPLLANPDLPIRKCPSPSPTLVSFMNSCTNSCTALFPGMPSYMKQPH